MMTVIACLSMLVFFSSLVAGYPVGAPGEQAFNKARRMETRERLNDHMVTYKDWQRILETVKVSEPASRSPACRLRLPATILCSRIDHVPDPICPSGPIFFSFSVALPPAVHDSQCFFFVVVVVCCQRIVVESHSQVSYSKYGCDSKNVIRS